jgi:hypothetical protein
MRRIVAVMRPAHSRRIHVCASSFVAPIATAMEPSVAVRRYWFCSMEVYMLLKKILGFAALGALLVVAAPAQQAQAATPVSPGIASAAQGDAGKLTTNVQWGHHHHRHWRPHHRHWRPHHHHHRHWRPHHHHYGHHRHWR